MTRLINLREALDEHSGLIDELAMNGLDELMDTVTDALEYGETMELALTGILQLNVPPKAGITPEAYGTFLQEIVSLINASLDDGAGQVTGQPPPDDGPIGRDEIIGSGIASDAAMRARQAIDARNAGKTQFEIDMEHEAERQTFKEHHHIPGGRDRG